MLKLKMVVWEHWRHMKPGDNWRETVGTCARQLWIAMWKTREFWNTSAKNTIRWCFVGTTRLCISLPSEAFHMPKNVLTTRLLKHFAALNHLLLYSRLVTWTFLFDDCSLKSIQTITDLKWIVFSPDPARLHTMYHWTRKQSSTQNSRTFYQVGATIQELSLFVCLATADQVSWKKILEKIYLQMFLVLLLQLQQGSGKLASRQNDKGA